MRLDFATSPCRLAHHGILWRREVPYLGYNYGELYGLYLTAVVMIFVFSYLVPDHWINHVHDGDPVTGSG